MVMSDAARTEWWESLPAGIREQIDGYVLQDSVMGAVRLVFNVGRASHGIGLNTAQAIVADRYEHYGDRIARTPDSPLDLDSLAYRAAGFPGRILAIEAIWDGDTVHDWFVELLAVTEDPETDHHLATVYYSTAKNHLAAQHTSDPRPLPAIAADRAAAPWPPTSRSRSTSPARTPRTTKPPLAALARLPVQNCLFRTACSELPVQIGQHRPHPPCCCPWSPS